MYKSLAVVALIYGAEAINLKFAVGQGDDEFNGETIQMKGPSKMESYTHVQLGMAQNPRRLDNEDFAEGLTPEEHDFKTTIRMKEPEGLRPYHYAEAGEDFAEGLTEPEHDFKTTIRMKEPEGLRPYHYAQKHHRDEFAEGLTEPEHDFKTTIRMKEPEGLRPYHYAQKHNRDEFAEGLTEPEHDFKTTIRMKEPEGLRPYNYISLNADPAADAPAGGATLARPSVPIRGEKQWQDWAQNLIDHQDHLTRTANTRPPYNSTVQLEDVNFVHISTEDGDELVKMDESHGIPLNFRF